MATAAEKQRRIVREKAEAQLLELPEAQSNPPVGILASWFGADLVLDVNFGAAGWKRYAYVPDDDLELGGIQELA